MLIGGIVIDLNVLCIINILFIDIFFLFIYSGFVGKYKKNKKYKNEIIVFCLW